MTKDLLVERTVDAITYVNYMSKFFTVMAALRLVFQFILIAYQFRRYKLNFKLSGFQRLIIWMIQCLTLMQTFYSFYWGYNVFIHCLYWSRNMNAFLDVNMFIIGILVTHYLFKAANKINKFSKKGKLPRER